MRDRVHNQTPEQEFYNVIYKYGLEAVIKDTTDREDVVVAWDMAYAAKPSIDTALNLLQSRAYDVMIPEECAELDMAAVGMIAAVSARKSEPGFVAQPRPNGSFATQCVVKYSKLMALAYEGNAAARRAMRIAKDARNRGISVEEVKRERAATQAGARVVADAQVIDLTLYRQNKVKYRQ